jgi:hypothetical protein
VAASKRSSRRDPARSRTAPTISASRGPERSIKRAARGGDQHAHAGDGQQEQSSRVWSEAPRLLQPQGQAEEDGVEDEVDRRELGVDADQRTVGGEQPHVEEGAVHAPLPP